MKDTRGCLVTRDTVLIYFLTPMGFSSEISVLYSTFVLRVIVKSGV